MVFVLLREDRVCACATPAPTSRTAVATIKKGSECLYRDVIIISKSSRKRFSAPLRAIARSSRGCSSPHYIPGFGETNSGNTAEHNPSSAPKQLDSPRNSQVSAM